jgi:hypothetical protein
MDVHIGIILFYTDLALLDTHSPARKSFCMPSEKVFLVQWHATHTLLLLPLCHWWNGGLSKLIWVDQSGDSQKEPVQDYMEMLQHLRVQIAEVFNGIGCSVRTGIILQYCPKFRQQSSAFGLNRWFQMVPKHFNINPSVGSVPKNNHHFSRRCLSFELLCDSRCRVFPFHTLTSPLWSITVNPRLVPSDITPQNSATCIMITVQ